MLYFFRQRNAVQLLIMPLLMQKRFLFSILLLFLSIAQIHAQGAQDSDVYCAVKKGSKWGFINKAGKAVIPFKLEDTYPFNEGVAAVKYKGKWGYLDAHERFVVKPIFATAHSFHDGRALISFNDTLTKTITFGYIEQDGDMVLPLADNQFGYDFHDGLARVRIAQGGDQAFGFVDTTGNFALLPNYELAMDFSEGAAAVFYNDKWGFIDEKGHAIIPPLFDATYGFHERLAYVEMAGKATYIDPQGKPVLPSPMTDIDFEYREGLVAFKKDGKMGFMDTKGAVVIPPKFDNKDFSNFNEGLAMVQVKDAKGNLKWGFCDKTGNLAVPAIFDFVKDFHYGAAVAVKNNKYGIIDMKGNWIIKPIYDDALGFTPYYR
jgi:hypothetical protein